MKYRIFQGDLNSYEVKRNTCLAWLDRDKPFLLHRARITNSSSGEEGHTAFDGIAVSVPAADDVWEDVLKGKGYQFLEKVWGPVSKTGFGTRQCLAWIKLMIRCG